MTSATDTLAAEPTSLTGIAGWATDLMDRLGAPGAGVAVALENLFPPLPSEIILPLAGFAASRGEMNLASAVFWTTLGSVVGALALYYVGALLGRDRTRALAARLPLVKLGDVDRTEAWFVRHGKGTVFLGRMIPIFRSLISIPAGIERMRLGTFLLAGYLLGENWHRVEAYAGILQNLVIAAVVVAVAWFVISRLARRDRPRGQPRG